MAGLPREVLKWTQSLDLTWQIKTPKWDLTNGYLVAEIFSWYFPQEIEMHMFNNGKSLDSKMKNWFLLKNFFKRHKFPLPEEYVDGTIHTKEGAAILLAECIYQILTNREVKKIPKREDIDFTDKSYQSQLPMHARSTASLAVKNNIRITELMADRNMILAQQKAQHIINDHIESRRDERVEDPGRFERKPTLGELAVRRLPEDSKPTSKDSDYMSNPRSASKSQTGSAIRYRSEIEGEIDGHSEYDGQTMILKIDHMGNMSREPTVQFKEISVNQVTRQDQLRQQAAVSGY